HDTSNEAVLRLVGASLLSFVAAAAVLLLFAYRLALRIRRLQRDADRAVSADGSVVGQLKPARGGDELAGLTRGMSDLLERLRGQQQYLRTLADKLAHELRTPLSMIGSSLDNLEAHLSEQAPHDSNAVSAWLARASQGQRRLRRILQAMSEASRLEEALIDEPFERFDLAAMVVEYIDGMDAARGPQTPPRIVLDSPNGAVPLQGSPDLIAQLLDKLLDNALGFTPEDGEIRVRVRRGESGPVLDVENDGPSIDPAEAADLFEPLISHRRGAGETPHLGLGLFIARLIMQRHGGRIEAVPSARGACFRATFPVPPKAA
ncbi:MAG: ATP-binding protein, partial [Wenzhouxiangellaceae bacterium]